MDLPEAPLLRWENMGGMRLQMEDANWVWWCGNGEREISSHKAETLHLGCSRGLWEILWKAKRKKSLKKTKTLPGEERVTPADCGKSWILRKMEKLNFYLKVEKLNFYMKDLNSYMKSLEFQILGAPLEKKKTQAPHGSVCIVNVYVDIK